MYKLSESAKISLENGELEESEELAIKILAEGKIPTAAQVSRPSLISAFIFVLKESGWIISEKVKREGVTGLNESEEERPFSHTERDANFTSKRDMESHGSIKATSENPASALSVERDSGWIEIGFWDDGDSEPDPLGGSSPTRAAGLTSSGRG